MYLIEQHMHPLASSSHSSTCWPFWLTVRAFSMSAAEQELNHVSWSLCFLPKLTITKLYQNGLAPFFKLRDGWCIQAIKDDCNLLAMLLF